LPAEGTGRGVYGLFGVQGKVALVTGARRGLGKAMALGLARGGADIAAVARSPEAGGLEAEVRALGRQFFYLPADLSHRSERTGLVDKVVARFGRLDILVNNAGTQHRAPASKYPVEQWDHDLSLLLTAVFEISQQAGRVMAERGGGKIILMASISSFQGAREIVGYSVSKHALVGLTKCLANEWAALNINVNAIAPGIFETDMAQRVLEDPAKAAELRGRIPSNRFGKPEDLVGPVLFLASEASRHVHGHVLLVDGGWMGR
jgi:2-dehydro-3-deoxy-D-gluconate 5-dehydrogenase